MKLINNKIMAFLIVASVLGAVNVANSQVFNPIVAITGSVFNQDTKAPLSAKYGIYDQSDALVYTSRSNAFENGYYYIPKLTPGKTYVIKFEEMGYFRDNFTVTIPATDKYFEISRDFLIKPLKLNQTIALPVIPFESNKSKLRYGAFVVLEDFKNSLLVNPRVKFTIVTYADNDNDKEFNQKLTTERADALMDYFVTGGVDPARIQIQGNETCDPKKPAPKAKTSKGKKYSGSVYLLITKI